MAGKYRQDHQRSGQGFLCNPGREISLDFLGEKVAAGFSGQLVKPVLR